jgi:hypothetical protein
VGKLHLPVVMPWVIAKKAMGRALFSCSGHLYPHTKQNNFGREELS